MTLCFNGDDKFMLSMSGPLWYNGILDYSIYNASLGKELYDHISYGGWNNKR